jgi:hypothetical protein
MAYSEELARIRDETSIRMDRVPVELVNNNYESPDLNDRIKFGYVHHTCENQLRSGIFMFGFHHTSCGATISFLPYTVAQGKEGLLGKSFSFP